MVGTSIGATELLELLLQASVGREKRSNIASKTHLSISPHYIVFSRKHGEGSSAKTLALLHKLDTWSYNMSRLVMSCHVMSSHVWHYYIS